MKNFLTDITSIVRQARSLTQRSVNSLQVISNYCIGMRIVTEEQNGNKRAEYGKSTLKELSATLTKEFGRGYSLSNLKNMRHFYLKYAPIITEKVPTVFEGSSSLEKSQTVSGFLPVSSQHNQTGSVNLVQISQNLAALLPLSWSHYLFLMGIDNRDERSFYEIEAAQSNWSLREMKRQFDTGLYERLAMSRDVEGVKRLAREGLIIEKPVDVIKDPLVLEFLGFGEHHRYSETELETAIIDKLEHFLLELGALTFCTAKPLAWWLSPSFTL